MAQMNSAEMEEFQNLSDRYQAELPGPLIGDKLPMAALVTEYAQADPAFVVKTTALARTHSAYRAIKGDGQCGWRSTVFAYFELLLQLGDLSLLQQEMIRLRSFEDTMKMVGFAYDILSDMFDLTWGFFDDIQKAIERQDLNEHVVLDFMNDSIKSDSIVYHFKMMTSAYMQLRPDDYEPFLEMTIPEYRAARIDPSNQEIDQIGLQALTDAIISPAGFALEVLYLDRSAGEEVTPHPFSQNGPSAPGIRLLYRPGHYDIVYRGSEAPMQVSFQNRQAIHQQTDNPSYYSNTYPGMEGYTYPGASGSQDDQSYNYTYMPPGSSSHHQYQYLYDCNVPMYYPDQQHFPPRIDTSMPSSSLPTMMPTQYSSPPSSSFSPLPVSAPPGKTTASEAQIRLNWNMYNLRRHKSLPLDPGSDSGGGLSPQHFRSSNFQPQMWNANEDYTTRP